MNTLNLLGMDYGASNGRGFVGIYDGNKICLKEINRFANTPVTLLTGVYWDIVYLYRGLKNTVINAKKANIRISSIGINSWAQDFGIIDKKGGLPHHYRDPGHNAGYKYVLEKFSVYELFQRLGYSPSGISTLSQLASMKDSCESALECGYKLLFIPVLLNYFLTGEISCDSTLASMSAMYNLITNKWDRKLLEELDLPDLLPNIIGHSEIAGKIKDPEMQTIGAYDIPSIMVTQHDTASAFTAMLSYGEKDTVYISCGTWGIIGVPVSKPIVTKEGYTKKFINELGYGNQGYIMRNTSGLWVLQECLKEWIDEGYKLDYDYLDEFTEYNPPNLIIDLDDELFRHPGNMNSKVEDYFNRSGCTPPSCKEELYSCVTYSLASKLSSSVKELELLTSNKYKKIQIVGGASKNKPLCKIIKQHTGKQVIAGPHEATIIGNMLAQLIYWKEAENLEETKDIVSLSFPLKVY